MDPSRSGVLCAGSVLVDVGKVIDAYPPRDRLATIEEVSLSTGGPGLNLAVDLRMLGARFPIGMLGAVGDDGHGRYIRSELDRLDIEGSGLSVVPGAATSFTDVMVERHGGRRTFFHHPGASAVFTATGADLAASGARVLHVGAPGIHRAMDAAGPDGGNGWSALLAAARAAGMHTNLELVSMDAERIGLVTRPCLPEVDSVMINELEAGVLTGREVPSPDPDGAVDWDGLAAVATGLIDLGVRSLAVVHFPAGAVAASASGRAWRQGSVLVPRDRVRSTVGAGDAFAAGTMLGLHEGWPVADCLRLGVASAAACLASPHTSAGIRPAALCLADADAAGYRPAS